VGVLCIDSRGECNRERGVHSSVGIFNSRNYLNLFRLNLVLGACTEIYRANLNLAAIGSLQVVLYVELKSDFIN
jgi:hypothetical protein